jgi:hypothetical protein
MVTQIAAVNNHMRRAISIESLVAAITNQRSYMLALSNTDLNEKQLSVLLAIYNENETLANLLGIQVPTLASIVQRHNEVVFLERLYRSSPDEESEGVVGIEARTNETTQQEISGVARVDNSQVGSHEA